MPSRRPEYIVVLDDDPSIHKVLAAYTGMRALSFGSSVDLIKRAAQYAPLAAFIDVHLGVADSGLEMIPILRSLWRDCPLFVVTGDGDEDIVSKAFQLGADDFIRKPIRRTDLAARLSARVQTRQRLSNDAKLKIGDVTVDLTLRLLRGAGGRQCYLTPTQVTLLACLIQGRGQIVSRSALTHRGWGKITVSDSALDRHLHEIRKALGELSNGVRLYNAYGRGFALKNRKKKGKDE